MGCRRKVPFEKRWIADDKIKLRWADKIFRIARNNPEPVFPLTLSDVFLQLPEGHAVQLDTLDGSPVFLRKHQHQQARPTADIQRPRPGMPIPPIPLTIRSHTSFSTFPPPGNPGPQYAGIGTHLHSAAILVDDELLELKIRFGHSERFTTAPARSPPRTTERSHPPGIYNAQ